VPPVLFDELHIHGPSDMSAQTMAAWVSLPLRCISFTPGAAPHLHAAHSMEGLHLLAHCRTLTSVHIEGRHCRVDSALLRAWTAYGSFPALTSLTLLDTAPTTLHPSTAGVLVFSATEMPKSLRKSLLLTIAHGVSRLLRLPSLRSLTVNTLCRADRLALEAAIEAVAAETGRPPVALHAVDSQYRSHPSESLASMAKAQWRTDLFDGFVAPRRIEL
jgi:hypothetical protein